MRGGICIQGVILAAGKGERLKGLTQTIPKALVQVAGKTLLERSIERLLEADVQNISIAVGWKSEMIRNAITRFQKLPGLQIIDVPDYEIGPLQTLTTALESIDGEETVICPVDLLISSEAISMIISRHNHENASVTLAVDPHGNSGSDVSVDSHGRVLGIQTKVDNAESIMKSAMFMVASQDFVTFCKNSLLQGSTTGVAVLNDMIELGHHIQSSAVSEIWFDTDTIDVMLEANRFLLESTNEQYPESVFIPKGDTMEIGDTLNLESGIKIGQGVSLIGPCLIHENSKIGENCSIGPHASLDKGTEVGECSDIQNAIIFGKSKIPNHSKVNGIIIYESKQFRMEE